MSFLKAQASIGFGVPLAVARAAKEDVVSDGGVDEPGSLGTVGEAVGEIVSIWN